jgi:Ca2+-transporting ATPase
MKHKHEQAAAGAFAVLRLALQKFFRIDGGQRAAAFAYSAFFALFPLILLIVTLASLLFDRAAASSAVVAYAQKYIPVSGGLEERVFGSIQHIATVRGKAGITAFFMLVWAATQFFTTIVHATNRAWGTEGHSWWRRPLKSLSLLGIMVGGVLFGIASGVLGKMARGVFHANVFFPWAYSVWAYFLPWLLLFIGLTLFYRLAPRRHTLVSEVWQPALFATGLLYISQSLFVLYIKYNSTINAVYGGFGGIIALMLWIYVSGVIFIFCACLCSALHETKATALKVAKP